MDKSKDILQRLILSITTAQMDMSGNHRYILSAKSHAIVSEALAYLNEPFNEGEGERMEFKTYTDAKRYCRKFGLTNREVFSQDHRCIAKALVRAYESGKNQQSNTQTQSDACECPQGSICEFFGKNEWCQYGKI